MFLLHHDYKERGLHIEKGEERRHGRGKTGRMKEKKKKTSIINKILRREGKKQNIK